MKTTIKSIVTFMMLQGVCPAQAVGEIKSKAERVAMIESKIAAAKKSQGENPVGQLLDAELLLNADMTGEEVLHFHLKILEAAISHENKEGAAKALPGVTLNVPTPSGFSGTDPAAVKDPAERADYERRIQENAEKAKKLNEQALVQHIKTNVLSYLRTSVKYLEVSPEAQKSQQQIISYLKTSTLPEKVKAEVMEVIGASKEAKK